MVPELPEETLTFLLGSRYCETDRLSETAWSLFGQSPAGWGRVQAFATSFISISLSAINMRGPPRRHGKPMENEGVCAGTSRTSRLPFAAA